MHQDPQSFATPPRLNPTEGVVIRRPPSEGAGYWVGAPGVMFDAASGKTYLTYRVRRPRGVQPDRGAEVHLAVSDDGMQFETIWTGTKDQLQTSSIERCALRRLRDDLWVLFISYVDPTDGRWRTDLVEASRPDKFDLRSARPIFTAAELGVEGVKDPFVFQVAGLYHMVLSYAEAAGTFSADEMHGTRDAYNTGLIRSATALATSSDGLEWHWEGSILRPSADGWDKYCARIGSLWQQQGVWLALYDGSADVSENYEERVGLAYSFDLRHFHRVTRTEPLWQTAHGRGAMRYFDVLAFERELRVYYERALADGSHELCVATAPR